MVLGGRQLGGRGGPFAARHGRAQPLPAAWFRLRDYFAQVCQQFRSGGRDVTTMIGYVAAGHFLREDFLSLVRIYIGLIK